MQAAHADTARLMSQKGFLGIHTLMAAAPQLHLDASSRVYSGD